MKHLQTFKMFESATGLTPDQIQFLDNFTSGSWSQDPTTGEINVEGSFIIPDNYTRDFKGLRFGKVTGDFDCSANSLTSLERAPTTVGRNFNCSHNSLTSLEGAPSTVEGYLDCSHNSLTSLEGAPSTVGRNFNCSHNSLTSLEGAPSTVEGYFDCSHNSLTSLEGAPSTVGKSFYCSRNPLTSLEGAPVTVEGIFICSDNPLTSLKGAPEVIKGGFYSDDLEIPGGEWGLPKFLEILSTGTERQKQLILPLVDPKVLQGKIDQDPEKMAIELKPVMNNPLFQKLGLKWPGHLQSEIDLLGDLEGIGL